MVLGRRLVTEAIGGAVNVYAVRKDQAAVRAVQAHGHHFTGLPPDSHAVVRER